MVKVEITGALTDDRLIVSAMLDGEHFFLHVDDTSAQRLYFLCAEQLGMLPDPSSWGQRKPLFLESVERRERIDPVAQFNRNPGLGR